MKDAEVKKRIKKLKNLINYHRYLYHVLDREEISQPALDSLKKELFDLEQKFPEFITPDSPTQRIAGRPLEKFVKVRHLQPMLSFNDAFSRQDLEDWLERNSKLLTPEEVKKIDFYCEPKLDGLAIELIYQNGILKTGSTRGDGILGEDVTQNLKTVESIPLRLRDREGTFPQVAATQIAARGEVIITKKEFEKINKEQIKKGQSPFANPRNLAAGSIRQLDPKVAAQRKLDVIAYGLISPARLASQGEAGGDFGQRIHEEEHKILAALGFKTNPHNRYCRNLKEVFQFHRHCQKIREKLNYEIDGIVVIVNNNKIFEKLGVKGKAPRGAIAYKFPLKQTTTVVEDILIQVGRTGAVTPVACLKPVKIGGVTISRATLHNEDEIKRLGLKIGDTVVVGRAGDVIPDIVKVLSELRTGKEKEFHLPKNCPACGTNLLKTEKEAVCRCPNPKCFAQQRRYFYYFVSKGAFNIAGLGPKIIDKLIDAGLVFDPADLFKLEAGDILSLERFAEKSAENLILAIQSKKRITLPQFIFALGIRNIGEETAALLSKQFPRPTSHGRNPGGRAIKDFITQSQNFSLEKLQKIPDIGPITAKGVYDWFHNEKNIKFLEKLKNFGIEVNPQQSVSQEKRLRGKTFVLTGTLETITRDEAKEKIRSLGGEVSESVSKKTNFVIVGKEPGSKLEKAKKLGVKIIEGKEFFDMIL